MTEAHYYPFGLALNGKWMTGAAEETKYRYNGKELNEDFGLNWLDYGARWYDASIGKWNAVDPSAEQYYSISTFTYGANNPILLVDPDGRKVEFGDNISKEDKKLLKRRIKYLRKNSETFNSIWKDLKKSKHVHTVNSIKGDRNSFTQIKDAQGYLDGSNRGSTININLQDQEINEVNVGNEIWIAHEVGHAWRNDQGKVNIASLPTETPTLEDRQKNPYALTNYNVDLQVAASTLQIADEVAASHIENIVRGELDPTGDRIPLRAFYKNLTRVSPTLEFIDGKLKKGMDIQIYDAPTIKQGYKYRNSGTNHYNNLKRGN